MKTCKECKETKPFTEFNHSHMGARGMIYKARCRPCYNTYMQNYYKKRPEESKKALREKSKLKFDSRWHKNYRLETKYGITLEEFEGRYKKQGGSCYICKTPTPDDHIRVDHCHKSGQVRKLLCHSCNAVLGLAKENPETLQACINYLREHNDIL